MGWTTNLNWCNSSEFWYVRWLRATTSPSPGGWFRSTSLSKSSKAFFKQASDASPPSAEDLFLSERKNHTCCGREKPKGKKHGRISMLQKATHFNELPLLWIFQRQKNILLFWGEDLQKSRVLVALTASPRADSHGSVQFSMGSTIVHTAVNIHVIIYLSLDHFKKKEARPSHLQGAPGRLRNPAVCLWDGGHVSQQLWKQSLSAAFRGHWANTLAGCTRSQPARITGRKILWLFEREVITLPPIIMKSWK